MGKIGIYKITAPDGKVYIGQTDDFEVRFNKYRLLHCEGQVRLYKSFMQFGVNDHKFEILEYCDVNLLNDRERHFQEVFNVLSNNGLNSRLTGTKDKKAVLSSATKLKISMSHFGKKLSPDHIDKLRAAKANISDETKRKISLANIGKKLSEETKAKMSERMKGNSHTKGMIPVNAKLILNTSSGVFYESASEAAICHSMRRTTLTAMLSGQNKNRTNLIYV